MLGGNGARVYDPGRDHGIGKPSRDRSLTANVDSDGWPVRPPTRALYHHTSPCPEAVMPNAVLTRLSDERSELVEFVDQTLALADTRDLVDAEMRNLDTTRERIA